MNIEKILYPKSNKLSKKGYIEIVDSELDLLKCQIVADSIEINTEGYTYITLSKSNLLKMIDSINKINQ
jgi:hypothetical protein